MVKKVAIFLFFFVLLFIGVLIAVYFFPKGEKIEFFIKNKDIPQKEGELSKDQKIGQLFVVGIKGKEVDTDTENFIKNYHPGGVLLLKDNIENEIQLKELVLNLQKIALNDTGLPLLIAVDQEGGLISRIKWAENSSQSSIQNTSVAFDIAKKRGEDLANDFITLNFSPVLDNAEKGDFVYDRTFMKNPTESGEMAKSMVSGYKLSKVFSCIKHFPGYVGITFNPEDKLAIIDKFPEIIQFKKAAEAAPEFIMISNVVYKELDPALPFSFLKSGIDFLKNNIPGDYIVVSDDLSQYSMLNNFSLADIVSKPINAGIDLIIFSNWRKNSEDGIIALKNAVEEGKVSQNRIDEAVSKIIKLKKGQ